MVIIKSSCLSLASLPSSLNWLTHKGLWCASWHLLLCWLPHICLPSHALYSALRTSPFQSTGDISVAFHFFPVLPDNLLVFSLGMASALISFLPTRRRSGASGKGQLKEKKNVSIRLARRQVSGASFKLMIDVGGPKPLWVGSSRLYKKAVNEEQFSKDQTTVGR